MAKKKYKDMNVDEKFIHDAISIKKVRIIGGTMFLALGIWMILTPEGMKHASREKATVWLLKEMWSPYLATVIIVIAVWGIIRFMSQLKIMSGYTWIKQQGGHYIYNNKERVNGIKTLANGKDKVAFNSAQNEVYIFENYLKTPLDKFQPAKPTQEFNCIDTYWIAGADGYSMVHKGQYVENMTSEYRGNDLIVTATDLGKKFKLVNYKSSLDNTIRIATRY